MFLSKHPNVTINFRKIAIKDRYENNIRLNIIASGTFIRLEKINLYKAGQKKFLDSRDPAGSVLQKFNDFFFIVKFLSRDFI